MKKTFVKRIFRKVFPNFFKKIRVEEPLLIDLNDDDLDRYVIYGYSITKSIGPVIIEKKELEEMEKEIQQLEKEIQEILKELSPLRATFGPLVFKLKEEFDINKNIAINLGAKLGEYKSEFLSKDSKTKLIDPRIIQLSEAFIDRYLLKKANIPEITEPIEAIPLLEEDDEEEIKLPPELNLKDEKKEEN